MEPATESLSAENTDSERVELGHEFIRYNRVIHTLRAQLADVLPAGLDPAAAQLLVWLAKQGPSRQGELAENTFLDPSTVSRRVSQLVQLGLVERRADQEDGRAVQLVLTALGQTFFTTIRARREEIMRQVLGNWSRAEVSSLSSLLRKFNDDFETYRSQSNVPITTHAPPND
ncbi:MAG TPA: MarR family winged helix-turn-helix transcriptional regulator [Kineosporiaceae bacterium]|nr:MarR family winged helix-turn-helix transcriptional regulator [Kineosporiaceae bacterium]